MRIIALGSAILAIRLLRPLVTIRFGSLKGHRIGHYTDNTFVYLCRRRKDPNRRRKLDLFYHPRHVSNLQLKRMWNRKLVTHPIFGLLDRLNRKLPGYEAHVVSLDESEDFERVVAASGPVLRFNRREEKRGEKFLTQMGLEPGASPVCFCARDEVYLETAYAEGSWRYHSHRDMPAVDYLPALNELTRRGYSAVRMGKAVSSRLETDNPRIIDYASGCRNDFMDIYLGANCRFYLGDTAGLVGVPVLFRRPVAFVNYIPLGRLPTNGPFYLVILKKLRWRKERRLLTFREVIVNSAAFFGRNEQYERLGLEVVNNTPEEIAQLAVEMDERLEGTRRSVSEDEDLQRRFWEIFHLTGRPTLPNVLIGADFLRQNRQLLD